jgi:predicted MPP superfamily phosphohydrolase
VSLVLIGMSLLAVAVLMHAVLIAPLSLRTTTIDVPVRGLAPAFDGYRLAVLADIHHWAPGESRHLRRMVSLVNDADPDLVVLLGDYGASFEHNRTLSATCYERALPALGVALRKLRSRDGLVAILGNHDHYYDGERVAAWLRSIGARVLINDSITLQRGDSELVVGGVGDALEDRVDPMGGAGGRQPGTPLIVLSHNPDAVLALSDDCRADLVLAGHTHGGQVVIPAYGAPVTLTRICGRRTASGWVPNERARLYVSTGIGSQWPIRFWCPPEVLVVQLRVAAQQPA